MFMHRLTPGSFRLFRVAGIDVFLHWSWLLVAAVELKFRTNHYQSQVWNVAEYLALFGIVLLHEFGHALACRQVGGTADKIVLWPLGGIAYVSPPPRPGAVLWSIAAGPLVNLALVPLTVGLWLVSVRLGWEQLYPDAYRFCGMLAILNAVLLVFNLLPVYPLDGGQIVQALLWFVLGRAKSLFVSSVLGMAVGLLGVGACLVLGYQWLALMAGFVAWRSWAGLHQARALNRLLSLPRHTAACPSCKEAPLQGDYWACNRCRTAFDTFVHHATCPNCGAFFGTTRCLFCKQSHPIDEWYPTVSRAEPADQEVVISNQ
jgi:Zn-dependent protease